ncbi:MAG: hypothetical protein ABSF95_15895 [Verrucomicrobiota bacterium]|jgi:hypothetical protein
MRFDVNIYLETSFLGTNEAPVTLSKPESLSRSSLPARTPSVAPPAKSGVGLWLFLLALTLPLICLADDTFHAGPLLDQFSLTLSPGCRTEAAGPFYYKEQQESRLTWAFPPLFSATRDRETDSEEFKLIYPVMSYVRYGGQYRWQLFQLLSFAGGPTQQENARHRITLFPFYFQQRSSDPGQNYTAYGPFYGHLENRLFRDEISYVMFPAYSQTRKGPVVTDNYLYPLFHLRHGPRLHGWQFWPLAGHEHKDITTLTNGFNEVETVPGHDKLFVLWPLFFNQRSGLGTDNPQRQHGLIPAYSLLRSPKRDSSTVLWPFFSRIDDRQQMYREWDAPWPLAVFARGQGKHTTRLWPFYSHACNSNLVSDFYLWPVYKYNRLHADPLDRQHTRILFYLYSDLTAKSTDSGAYRRRVQVWPFFTYHRALNGNRQLQVLALVEPFLPENPGIECEYAPLYSFWRSEKNPTTGAASQSLLWNLYRRQTAPNSRRVSACFGLYQHEAGPKGKRLRLFYIPVSHKPAAGSRRR